MEFAFVELFGFLAGFGEEDELAEVAESGGAACGDAIGGHGFEDACEGAVDVEMAIVWGEELVEFAG